MRIVFENLFYNYHKIDKNVRPALSNVNLKIDEHEFIAIVGPTGSGKTTLIQHFTGLLRPSSGKITIDGQLIPTKGQRLAQIRRSIGLVFQFPEKQLFEETVYGDIAFGPKNLGFAKTQIEASVRQAMTLVDLDYEQLRDRSPHRLSEGEKRRVALAGVLAMDPQMLLLDEPTACLDPRGVKCIETILVRLFEIGKTIIVISHNIDFVFRLAKRIIVLSDGKITYDGGKKELLKQKEFLVNAGLDIPRITKFFSTKFELDIPANWSQLLSIEEVSKLIIDNKNR